MCTPCAFEGRRGEMWLGNGLPAKSMLISGRWPLSQLDSRGFVKGRSDLTEGGLGCETSTVPKCGGGDLGTPEQFPGVLL